MDCAVPSVQCPARFYCPRGTGGGAFPPLPCFPGHACYAGTGRGDAVPCPPGTFSASTSLAAVEECSTCPEGFHCVGGQAGTSGPCGAGHFCPAGTALAASFPCPAGGWL
jgi:hypothetical protein